jgi:hypothetical protein
MPIRSRRAPSSRQARRRNPEAGATHPALPAVILLVFFSVFMAAIAPLDFSTIIAKFFPPTHQTVPHQDAAVWVNTNSGVYYCANSIMFGTAPGHYMKQVDALDHGYQPALETYCTGPAWHIPSQAAQPAPVPTTAKPVGRAGENLFENPQSQFASPGTAPAPPR